MPLILIYLSDFITTQYNKYSKVFYSSWKNMNLKTQRTQAKYRTKNNNQNIKIRRLELFMKQNFENKISNRNTSGKLKQNKEKQ